MVCELDRLHFYKQTSQLGSKNSMTDLEIKTEEKLYIVSIAKVAFQLITLLFETYNVVQSMLRTIFSYFSTHPAIFCSHSQPQCSTPTPLIKLETWKVWESTRPVTIYFKQRLIYKIHFLIAYINDAPHQILSKIHLMDKIPRFSSY